MRVLGALVLLAVASEVALRLRHRPQRPPVSSPAEGEFTLVALGDSIVAGAPGPAELAWPAALARRLVASGAPAAALRMVNAGVSGDTAPRGLARFDRDVAVVHPQIVLIAFGLNDCYPGRIGMDRWLEDTATAPLERLYLWRAVRVRGEAWARRIGLLPPQLPEGDQQPIPRTSPQGFSAALAALIARTREIGARPALLSMPPLAPVDTEGVRLRLATYPAYNKLIAEAAAQRDVPLAALVGAPADAWEPDGFHLSAAGQAWVAEMVQRRLAEIGWW
jgi:lysophospholipase L1-like esterase